jgi:hypothetical protein
MSTEFTRDHAFPHGAGFEAEAVPDPPSHPDSFEGDADELDMAVPDPPVRPGG